MSLSYLNIYLCKYTCQLFANFCIFFFGCLDRIHSRAKAHASSAQQDNNSPPSLPQDNNDDNNDNDGNPASPPQHTDLTYTPQENVSDTTTGGNNGKSEDKGRTSWLSKTGGGGGIGAGTMRFLQHTKNALFHSWVNILLVFVPLGIAVEAAGLSPAIIFAMNAVAIIPLAGMLSHATESVASRLGDTVGALINVTFGNAVELIILYVCRPFCICSQSETVINNVVLLANYSETKTACKQVVFLR